MAVITSREEKEALVKQLLAITYQHSRRKEYQQARDLALEINGILPNIPQVLSDIATYSIFLQDWVKAIEYALLCISIEPKHINSHDVLAHAFGALYDWEPAGQYGRKALELRDEVSCANNKVPPQLPSKISLKGKQNIISFSLYGASPDYNETAVLNAELVDEFYPDWRCRFYVDETVPQSTLARLEAHKAEIIYATPEMKKLPPTMWRFLALEDPNAGYVIFRDADSVISRREATTVEEWVKSGRRFHTIRDSGAHTELIMAGLWGALAGSVPQFSQKMFTYVQTTSLHPRFADQFFLRDYIWQYVRQDLYASDRLFGFFEAHPITSVGENYDITHIGCDEGGYYKRIDLNYEDGQKLTWRLYSQISPLPNDDLSPRYIPERFICEYEAVVKDRAVSVCVPKRYGDGLTTGKSRLEILVAKE
ncbi:Uncharacterised protein [Streptococcus criceti]|uniref:Tetratricopeptide repeat protein n=1 Tax=Streptococcus criceti HS-6 TaxID=873449 RepID=G5JSA5_STRCG|nr:hypothetical protein [Streptococcus criceti]EHI74342.1 hypothetical protein STRCR_0883 [Streptococcus criceti HS-6]SUN37467.1 Uncharacterised protein [Streptococcus criceti]